MQEPVQGAPTRRDNGARNHNGKKYDVIYQEQDKKWIEQAYRYPKETWTASEAGGHCKNHNGSFEAAQEGDKGEGVEVEKVLSTIRKEKIYMDSIVIGAFSHNSTVDNGEPDWGSVDKTKLPRPAFAGQGEPDKKSTWDYPHHWVKGGGGEDNNGVYTTGTMYLHRGGLGAAWAAANGSRSGQQASSEVKSHLDSHRKAIGMGDENQKKGERVMAEEIVTKETFSKAYPELFVEIQKEAYGTGLSEGIEMGKKQGFASGAEAERERIQIGSGPIASGA